MANERMKISTALMTYEGLQKSMASLNGILNAISSDAKLHDSLMHKVQEQTGEKKDPTYVLNGAINHINEYAVLLKSAIDRTEMEWPPGT